MPRKPFLSTTELYHTFTRNSTLAHCSKLLLPKEISLSSKLEITAPYGNFNFSKKDSQSIFVYSTTYIMEVKKSGSTKSDFHSEIHTCIDRKLYFCIAIIESTEDIIKVVLTANRLCRKFYIFFWSP